jgi:hypothetical protein
VRTWSHRLRGRSSIGRAPRLQRGGCRFEPDRLQFLLLNGFGGESASIVGRRWTKITVRDRSPKRLSDPNLLDGKGLWKREEIAKEALVECESLPIIPLPAERNSEPRVFAGDGWRVGWFKTATKKCH